VRAAARLSSAGSLVARSSVGGAQSRVSSGLSVAPWLACNKSDGEWAFRGKKNFMKLTFH
jgi:hypothetical protein